MQMLTELIVRIADLVEAEGKVLRSRVVGVVFGACLMIVAACAVIAGLVLELGAVYILISDRAGPAAAAAATGLVALTTGGILAWLGRRMSAR